jgi:RimJ/RimL family protein N-acetyltransferase
MSRENEFGQLIGDPVDWAGAREPARVTLAGRSVRLVPVNDSHLPGIVGLGEHPDLWTYQSDEAPRDRTQAEVILQRMMANPDAIAFAIEDAAAGAFLGRASLMRVQPQLGSIEVGSIIYSPRLKRSRAATEAQYLLMRYVFDDLGYRRYEWKCDAFNVPSRVAAARLGFTEEGTWRNALLTKGRNRDTTWFSVADYEWPALRAGFESWLDDSNFDAAGRQRRRLAELRNP